MTAAWSHAALEDFMLQSVLLYLAVAHFGRGRGNWTESEYPPAWKETVEKVLKNHQAEDKHLPIMVQPVLEETLKTLYPFSENGNPPSLQFVLPLQPAPVRRTVSVRQLPVTWN